METITIPSPSAFLNSPVSEPAVSRPATASSSRRPSVTPKTTGKQPVRADGTTKPKQSKSRNGCITCKAKRLKCDETKPTCQQCEKRSVTCGGYKKDFKWRPFEEASFASRLPTQKPTAKKSPPSQPPKVTGKDGSTGTSPTLSESSLSNATSSFSTSYQDTFLNQNPISSALPSPNGPPIDTPGFPTSPNMTMDSWPFLSSLDDPQMTPTQIAMDNFEPGSVTSSVSSMFGDPSNFPSATSSTFGSSGQSPKLIDLLLPGTDLNVPPPEFQDFRAQQPDVLFQTPPQPMEMDIKEEDDVEEIIRKPPQFDVGWNLMELSPTSSSSSDGSSPDGSDPMKLLFEPGFKDGSPEMLMVRFDRQTCGILSIKDGPTENPWRTLVWPLARESPALYHAIASLTAFHTSKEKQNLRVDGLKHMRRSIKALSRGINQMRTDTALATTLILAFCESWDQHIRTGIEHLRGSRVLVGHALDQAMMKHGSGEIPMLEEDLTRLKFLCNTFVYMDVISRLTSTDDDESNPFDTVVKNPFIAFQASTEMDPLMGCATTLFPLIGRAANLVRKVRKVESNSPVIISEATNLKTALEQWEAPDGFEQPEDPSLAVQHSIQTAEAYRWATLLYLHQAVPEVPSLTTAQLADKVLVLLATVPLSSRAVIVQIFPLLAAGCEATNPETRQWVKDRWEAMMKRMWIGNIDRCWEVTSQVWVGRDLFQGEKQRQRERRQMLNRPGPGADDWLDNGKRKFAGSDEQEWLAGPTFGANFGRSMSAKRRATLTELGMPVATRLGEEPPRRSSKVESIVVEKLDLEVTVRGRLHWLGVMQAWGWEVLLG